MFFYIESIQIGDTLGLALESEIFYKGIVQNYHKFYLNKITDEFAVADGFGDARQLKKFLLLQYKCNFFIKITFHVCALFDYNNFFTISENDV